MRVAIAHDYLNQYGGAERVLEAIMEIFPKAPVYTLLYDEARTLGRFQKYDIRPSFLNHFEMARNRHRRFIPIFPLAQELMSIGNDFDLVVSSSAGFAKGKVSGLTSPHAGTLNQFWPMATIMQAMTTDNENEIAFCLRTLKQTHAGTYFMHESVNVDNPKKFTRPWFGWANSLFGELILNIVEKNPKILEQTF